MPIKNMLALFGAVVLVAGLAGWMLHVPEGTSPGDIIYGDYNYIKNLAAGTSGQFLKTNGAGSAPSWANAAIATGASGVMVAGGTVTLDGANPATAATGLTYITACSLTNVRAATPGDEVTHLTYIASGAVLNVYQWNTDGTDPTLKAAGDANDVIAWVCTGPGA
jgi:hypothetical protein